MLKTMWFLCVAYGNHSHYLKGIIYTGICEDMLYAKTLIRKVVLGLLQSIGKDMLYFKLSVKTGKYFKVKYIITH